MYFSVSCNSPSAFLFPPPSVGNSCRFSWVKALNMSSLEVQPVSFFSFFYVPVLVMSNPRSSFFCVYFLVGEKRKRLRPASDIVRIDKPWPPLFFFPSFSRGSVRKNQANAAFSPPPVPPFSRLSKKLFTLPSAVV